MPIPAPNLDDRDQQQLLDEASQLIRKRFPNWDDSASNPGQALLEVFAHLTEALIYRLNRLPEKSYIQFLNLIGTRLNPPTAASATLKFSLGGPAGQEVEIPRATRVSVERTDASGEMPIFTTDESAVIGVGQSEVLVTAHACSWVQGELAGVGTGLPGQSLTLLQAPLIQRVGHEYDLIIGVELLPEESAGPDETIDFGDKRYLKWTEVDNFTLEDGSFPVYNVDRVAGTIYFDPGENGKVPQAGREIRAWYRSGGGAAGNVTAGMLTVLKDALPGFSGNVSNPEAASGGRDAENLPSALRRGPRQLHSLERAVTARDFELLAINSSQDIARAWPFTRAENWSFARPGEVEVLLVPRLPADQLSLEALVARQNETVRLNILNDLSQRHTLGVSTVVNWTRYKPVRIQANLIINRYADREVIKARVINRLNQVINPIPAAPDSGQSRGEGWPFGQTLHASLVYQICQAEPGVRFVDGVVKFLVDETPSKSVEELLPDPFQPGTWYAGAADSLYRSQDNGDGWVRIASFPGETVLKIAAHPARPGRLAVFTVALEAGKKVTHLYLSDDCGENLINTRRSFTNVVNDAAWVTRSGKDLLLLVGSEGLLEIRISEANYPEAKIIVNTTSPATAFRSIAAALDDRGLVSVAVSSDDTTSGGVYLSNDGGRTFPNKIGLDNKRVTVLTVQRSADQRLYLWAGIGALPGDKGEGCYRWELLGGQRPPDNWKPFTAGWSGGSCNTLAFIGSKAAAGSYSGGVLLLDPDAGTPTWSAVNLTSGLARSGGALESVTSVGSTPPGSSGRTYLLAAGKQGVFRSEDGSGYICVSTTELLDKVTLPPTRLFCAGQHAIEAWYEDERK